LGTGAIGISPLLPRDWQWMGIRRLAYHGRELGFFAARQRDSFHVFGTADFDTTAGYVKHLSQEDLSDQIYLLNALAHHVAFKRPGELMICLGAAAKQTIFVIFVPLRLDGVLEAGKRYHTQVYNSERGAWVEGEISPAEGLNELDIDIEEGGYRLLRFLEHA
jgi:hypothetical protein